MSISFSTISNGFPDAIEDAISSVVPEGSKTSLTVQLCALEKAASLFF